MEFDKVYRNWKHLTPNWLELFPEEVKGKAVSDSEVLMPMQLGVVLKNIMDQPNYTLLYGYLPLLSETLLGSMLASSYVERVNSQAKLVMTTGRTLLAADELEIVAMLRMNRDFMLHMKEKYKLDDDGEVVLRKVTVTKGAAVVL
jgi:hypothetical protein